MGRISACRKVYLFILLVSNEPNGENSMLTIMCLFETGGNKVLESYNATLSTSKYEKRPCVFILQCKKRTQNKMKIMQWRLLIVSISMPHLEPDI